MNYRFLHELQLRVQQNASEEGRRSHRLKCCENNTQDEDSSPNNINNKKIFADNNKKKSFKVLKFYSYKKTLSVKLQSL